MEYGKLTLQELASKSSTASTKKAVVGLDGFVDKIIKVVDSRQGQGDQYTPIPTIEQFGNRIIRAAGKSANIELYTEYEKLGGNGPIMANALLAEGLQVQYIGALGIPLNPVFEEFAAKTKAASITDPGVTNALEFEDGKIMLGLMASLDNITYDTIIAQIGEGNFIDMISRADLISWVNWTMIPNMTQFFEALLANVLPNLGPKESGRYFYFDLTDPAKRSKEDLREVVMTIKRFQSHGSVTLGLNYSEGCQVAEVLGLGEFSNSPEDLKSMCVAIRNELAIGMVVVHPREGAACANRDDSWYVEGPFCKNPKISTGAGDHFNAGFAGAQVIGLSPPACLMVAVAVSGQYVRTGKSPNFNSTAKFIEGWTNGNLND